MPPRQVVRADGLAAVAKTSYGTGLTTAEVAQRVACGRTNAVAAATSRPVGQIVRANVLTVFNGLLATLFVIILSTGRWQNSLFGLVIVANSAIGIVQEVRAKRTLDRLVVLSAARAVVVRDDAAHEIETADIVVDDLLLLRTGDQVPADALVLDCRGLEIDESLLTGESDAVVKNVGDEVRSGSIVVAGHGEVRVTAVGAESYANGLAAAARRFKLTHSELVAGTNRLLRWISLSMLVIGPLVLWSQFRSKDNHSWQDSITATVAALVGMVPEGLVLLTSLAFMMATVNLARRQTLVQELPAVEGLARVDVVCLDKTGTITTGDIGFEQLHLLGDTSRPDVASALALICQTLEPNATTAAVGAVFDQTSWTAAGTVAFSSSRKWAAVTANEGSTWVFGAPEMVLAAPLAPDQVDVRERADRVAAGGRRVLLLMRGTAPLPNPPMPVPRLPADLVPAALIVLSEQVRDDAAAALRYFAEQGVALKVISGDNPHTVGAVAARVGVPGAEHPIDAQTLSEDVDQLATVLDTHSVFGRVSPAQKRAFVAALQRRGHVVAMTGDGVNDALALKDADIGVAMGNGAAATRAVAQIVLLDGRFSHLPDVVAEGRRVMANIERAAGLFFTKNVYSLVLAIITGLKLVAYPLAPIQLTLISTLSIGVPGFVLALGPNRRRYMPGFLTRVLRFGVPTGVITGGCAYASYRLIRAWDAAGGVSGARTSATLTVLVIALWTLLVLARPLAGWKIALVAAMTAAVALVVVINPLGHGVFLLDITADRVLVALAVGAVGAGLVELAHRIRRNSSTHCA